MKVAIVHEWLEKYAGSERVLEQMIRCFPDVDVLAVVDFLKPGERGFLQGRPVRTSFVQKLPFVRKYSEGQAQAAHGAVFPQIQYSRRPAPLQQSVSDSGPVPTTSRRRSGISANDLYNQINAYREQTEKQRGRCLRAFHPDKTLQRPPVDSLSAYDLVWSSNHAVAKGILTGLTRCMSVIFIPPCDTPGISRRSIFDRPD